VKDIRKDSLVPEVMRKRYQEKRNREKRVILFGAEVEELD
jgi:hypothetical protein